MYTLFPYTKTIRKWLACVFCVACCMACENNMEEVKNFGKKTTGIEEGKMIENYLSSNGIMKAKLRAPLMLRYLTDTAKIEFPKTLHVDFYDSLAAEESWLDAKYGRYLEYENKVLLRDSVIFKSKKGDTLWCHELYWDQNAGTFFTDKPAIISQKQPLQKIYAAKGLIADQNFRWFTLNGVGKKYTGNNNFIAVPDSTY